MPRSLRHPFQFGLAGLLVIVAIAGLGARLDWPFTAAWLTILGIAILMRSW